jgi:hypothetical protein
MAVNTIRFLRITCQRAEAIFGDMVEILYNGSPVWSGVMNTNGSIMLPDRRRYIPGGIGANVTIDQWYFGQPRETVFRTRVLQSDSEEDRDDSWVVEEFQDSDPGGIYTLFYRVTRERWGR